MIKAKKISWNSGPYDSEVGYCGGRKVSILHPEIMPKCHRIESETRSGKPVPWVLIMITDERPIYRGNPVELKEIAQGFLDDLLSDIADL